MGARKSRPSPPPPLKKKKRFLAILGAFLLLFLHMGAILLLFLHMGAFFATFLSFCGSFHHVGAFLLLFTSWWELFWASPPPTKISAGAHDCKEGSRACSPEIFWCNRNLVSSGHILLRFCLKNDKNIDKL